MRCSSHNTRRDDAELIGVNSAELCISSCAYRNLQQNRGEAVLQRIIVLAERLYEGKQQQAGCHKSLDLHKDAEQCTTWLAAAASRNVLLMRSKQKRATCR